MLVHLSVLLMLSGLTGVSSITTISRVSVKANSFISIPCLYDPKFKTNVKYLCEGEEWPICTYVAKTNEVNSERFRINDDVSQNVFTVRIRFYKNLLNRKGVYWCAVEIIKDPDVMDSFYLSLASGKNYFNQCQRILQKVVVPQPVLWKNFILWENMILSFEHRCSMGTHVIRVNAIEEVQVACIGHPLLHVDNQEVTASPGDNVTIKCYYGNAGHSRWCRLGGFCVTGLFGTLDGTHVIIDHNVPGVFTVTMGRVRTESRGWYFCARGSLQMPVHLIIIQQPSTKVRQFLSPFPTAKSFFSTSASAAETSASAGETSASAGETSISPDETSDSAVPNRVLVYSLTFSITVVLCAVTAGVMIVICFKVKRSTQTRSSSTEADDEVEYSVVTYRRKASAKENAKKLRELFKEHEKKNLGGVVLYLKSVYHF
ncbi:uncharacterized protein LOC114481868 [Gouania willdenowi]|uniref:uncharacterized protein LOC114481868 n=1 Tax=Gouania willdenowi TaxID=441366 RepID=UPI001056AB8F|nr:uncharacterized protein LOC114481868 [Gouania willdenowi]